MRAYYYKIVEFSNFSQKEGNIVEEGIIRDAEDTVYPRQNTGIKELPYECEAHHFRADGYKLEGFYFDITRQEIYQNRL